MIVPFLKNLANPFRSRVVWLFCYSHSRRGKGRKRASFGDCLVFLSLLPRIPYLRSTETQYHLWGGGREGNQKGGAVFGPPLSLDRLQRQGATNYFATIVCLHFSSSNPPGKKSQFSRGRQFLFGGAPSSCVPRGGAGRGTFCCSFSDFIFRIPESQTRALGEKECPIDPRVHFPPPFAKGVTVKVPSFLMQYAEELFSVHLVFTTFYLCLEAWPPHERL